MYILYLQTVRKRCPFSHRHVRYGWKGEILRRRDYSFVTTKPEHDVIVKVLFTMIDVLIVTVFGNKVRLFLVVLNASIKEACIRIRVLKFQIYFVRIDPAVFQD